MTIHKSSVEVTHVWNCTSTSAIMLHILRIDKFIFRPNCGK